MKKVILSVTVIMIVFMMSSLVSAQTPLLAASSKQATVAVGGSNDGSGWLTVKPAASLGFLWNFGSTYYSVRSKDGLGLGGSITRDYNYDGSPAIYVAGRLPFTFGKRLEVALSGSVAIPIASSEVDQAETYPGLAGRTWEDARTYWVTANLQASYALVKDFHFLKAFAPVVGLRYDYWHTSYDDPTNVYGLVVCSPTDKIDFYSAALLPYVGLETTISGLKTGWFGGDLKLSAIGGWTAWGKVRHKEDRNLGAIRLDVFKGNLDSGSYFVEVGGEYTMFSFALSRSMQLSLSLFTTYSLSNANGELDGTRNGGVGPLGQQDTVGFEMNRSAITGGITGEITF